LADFLEVPHQQFSTELKDWSVYHVKKMLLRFMVKQAAEKLKPVISKSAATRSRAGRPYRLTTVLWIDLESFYAVNGAGIVVAIIHMSGLKQQRVAHYCL